MKTRWIYLPLILFSLTLTKAQEAKEAKAQAKIEFQDTTIDYGTLAKGSDGVRTFKFTNTGTVPLKIFDVKSSCGCTIPKKPEKPIAPGEEGEIQVAYDVANRVGVFRKTITVSSNADTPIVALKIKGNVLAAKEN